MKYETPELYLINFTMADDIMAGSDENEGPKDVISSLEIGEIAEL